MGWFTDIFYLADFSRFIRLLAFIRGTESSVKFLSKRANESMEFGYILNSLN